MESTNQDLPLRVFLGKLSNVSKSDAKNYCKGLINKYFNDKENTYYSIKKNGSEIYYEIQEGGNLKSFLPSIIKFIENENENEIIIPSGTKNVKIKKIEDSIYFEILTESDEENKEKQLDKIKRSGKMTPYEGNKKQLLAFSISVFILGIILLVTSYLLYFTKASISVENKINPKFSSFEEKIDEINNINNDQFVNKLYFENNRWNVEIKNKTEIEELSSSIEQDLEIEDGFMRGDMPLPPPSRNLNREE